MGGSPKFSLNSVEDWKRIGKGAVIAFAGFGATWIATVLIPSLQGDSTDVAKMALTAALGVVANALRLFASDTTE